MRICAITNMLARAFADAGHEVCVLWPQQGGALDLRRELAEREFTPDLIFQQEALGPRVLVQGLEEFDCPKIFWSIDTHLNLFWHRHYARLFDGLMTPHLSVLRSRRAEAANLPEVAGLAFYGRDIPWKRWSDRPRTVGFVGRFTEHRPARRWLADVLEAGPGTYLPSSHTVAVAEGLTTDELYAFYADTQLAPNESIMREVNFRLLEAASCGCATLNPAVGEDQDRLLTAGREMAVYDNVLELQELLAHYARRPDEAEAMGRRAWERVQAEHLSSHRVRDIVQFAGRLSGGAAQGAAAHEAYWLAVEELRRAGRFVADAGRVEQALLRLEPTPPVVAALIRIRAENGRGRQALDLCAALIARNEHADSLEVNMAGSAAGMFLDQWDVARQFWYRRCRATGRESTERPETAVDLLLLWETELRRAGALAHPGFPYSPGRHLPRTASDCLYRVLHLHPDHPALDARFESLFALLPGYEYMRLGHLSKLSLRDPDNWRTGLSLGMANLRACRPGPGLEELRLARTAAAAQGRERGFFRALAGMDPSGAARRTLEQEESD